MPNYFQKTTMLRLSGGGKKLDDKLSRFDIIPDRIVTDRRLPARHLESAPCLYSRISRPSRYSTRRVGDIVDTVILQSAPRVERCETVYRCLDFYIIDPRPI